jgi:hypothetical protein
VRTARLTHYFEAIMESTRKSRWLRRQREVHRDLCSPIFRALDAERSVVHVDNPPHGHEPDPVTDANFPFHIWDP